MAIYRSGTASLDASGKAVGTGTKWKEALSLIRIGATVIFLSGSKPVMGSIAEIISDTEMNLIGTDGQSAASGEYVILLSDSLTVDGLAQDIAETLRYYQGKESSIEGLIDQIEAYLKRAEDSATASQASSTASEASSQSSSASASESARQVGLASDQVSLAKAQADSAASSADSSQQSAIAAKTSETNAGQKATDAAASASAANTSETNAGQKATEAAASASAAKTSETNAATTLSVAAIKSQNLNDLANKSTAWLNLLNARTAANARTDLGLGGAATLSVGSAAGTVAAGNDSRFSTINGNSGGTLSVGSTISLVSGAFGNPSVGSFLTGSEFRTVLNSRGANGDSRGAYFGMAVGEQVGSSGYGLLGFSGFGESRFWNFYQNGNAAASGSWINGSDERHKTDIKNVKDALKSVVSWRGATYERLDGDKEVGLIAQDVEKSCPEAVINVGRREFRNGTVIEDFKALNTPGVSAAYMVEALKDVVRIFDLIIDNPELAKEKIRELKSIIAD